MQLLTKWTDINIAYTSICKYCWEDFPLYDLELKNLKKHWFKNTEECGLCIFKMHGNYFNDKNLYHRKDDFSGNPIISLYHQSLPWKVMDVKDYKKKVIDDFGFDYWLEISDDIIGDYKKLHSSFPRPSRLVYPSVENSDYSSHIGWWKNMYLTYCAFIDVEDIYYSLRVIWKCQDVYNSYNIIDTCANIFSSATISKSYDIFYSYNVVSSQSIWWWRDMNNCQECLFSCNQVNSNYKIFNVQYSKEEYEKIKADIMERIKDQKQFDFLNKKYEEFLEKNYIRQAINMNRCEKVVGESTFDSKNTVNSFGCNAMEDCINVWNGWDNVDDHNKNIFHSTEFGTDCENIIWSYSFGCWVYNTFFSSMIQSNSKNIYYCNDIESSEECMFSIGLKNKKYCILNKQYSKEEYFKEKEKIIKQLQKRWEWWAHIWWEISDFAYNDSMAYDYFKVHRVIYADGREEIIDNLATGTITILSDDFISDAVLDLWWKEKINIRWRTKDIEVNVPEAMDSLQAKDLPSIDKADESILEKAIICEETGRPYRIVKKELEFLKKKWLPIPRVHHSIRIEKLLSLRPIWKLYIWTSDLSGDEILSVYKEKPKWKIYSHEEYQDFMYK